MDATDIAISAAAMLVTTTIVKTFRSDWTAEGRAEALQKRFDEVAEEHRYFVENVLPRFYIGGAVPRGADKRTAALLHRYDRSLTFLVFASILILRSARARNNQIIWEISCSGVYRWSPWFKKRELERLRVGLDKHLMRSSVLKSRIAAEIEVEMLYDDEEEIESNDGEETGSDDGAETESVDGEETESDDGIKITMVYGKDEGVTHTMQRFFGLSHVRFAFSSHGALMAMNRL